MKHLRELIRENKAKKIYNEYYLKGEMTISELIEYYVNKHERIAIWGAGFKGIAFLNAFDKKCDKIACIYDIDKEKQGRAIVKGHNVVNYKDTKYIDIGVIFLMNSNYEAEITGMLSDIGREVKIINIDSIICGNMTFQETLALYERKE